MSAAFTRAAFAAISFLISESKARGSIRFCSAPSLPRLSFTAGFASAFAVSRWSLSTMSRGVAAGGQGHHDMHGPVRPALRCRTDSKQAQSQRAPRNLAKLHVPPASQSRRITL